MDHRTKQNSGDDFSREREFKVILEDIYSQFRVFGEGMGDLRNKFENLETRFDKLETRFDKLETRFDGLETKVDGLDRFIKMIMPTIATKDDLRLLEKSLDRRITALETTR